ncbi:RNA-directed DNA polymerase, eukaryota, reverse transcriptase zinc-binding domain protein [Tanacetum coccineum]
MKRPLNKLAWKDGNLFQKVKKLEDDLKKVEVEVEVEADLNNKEIKEKMSKILYDYNEAITDEEKLLSQKAKGKWFQGVKVAEQFLKHFEKFWIIMITGAEIKEAIFRIGDEKAPGPDGFTAVFFKKSWNIVEKDVCDVVQEFHKKIIGRIMTCVTSASFSICINGERYGYFKSGRGPRQEDLMSPYLFTLIMEVLSLIIQRRVSKSKNFKYHWGCKELKLTQCFANDILMLCNRDYKSVKVLKEGLMEFNKVSSLIPNMNKSTIFFGSVKVIEKMWILEIMPFVVGKLPMKYLGVPLITKNIGITECN